MCYAFVDGIKELTGLIVDGGDRSHHDQRFTCTATNDIRSTTTSLKRSADSDFEHQRAKVAKCSKFGESDNELSQFQASSDAQAADEEIDSLKENLTKANARIKTLEQAQNALEEKKDDLKYQVLEFQVREEKRDEKEKTDKEEAKIFTKQMVKKAVESEKSEDDKRHEKMRKKFQKKIDEVRKEYEDKIENLKSKHEEQIVSKDGTHKKKIDEIRAKNQQLEKETKDAKAQYMKAEKDMKAEHQRIQKELRVEQQEQIKQWKPEHSKALKEKDGLLKEKQKEISSVECAKDQLKAKAEKFEKGTTELHSQIGKLQKDTNEKSAEIHRLQNALSTRCEELEKSLQTNDDLVASYNAKLIHEGQRWQLQYDRGEKFAQVFTEQQRANARLRDGHNDSVKRVGELEIELICARKEIEALKANKLASANASTQTEEDEEILSAEMKGACKQGPVKIELQSTDMSQLMKDSKS